MLPRLAMPPSRAALVVLALAYVLPGLVSHDPWKAVDAVAIEIAHQMLLTGDWLVPRLAGEPWLADPPLYHWTAALFGALLERLLGFHGAARIASALYVLAALAFAYHAARRLAPEAERPQSAALAVLLVIGAVGIIVHAHEALPELATLAAACAALYFLSRAPERPAAMGAGFGAALGAAFLASGFSAPAMLLAAALASHLACDELRTRRAPLFLAAAAAVGLALAASWPAALWLRAPEIAAAWWQTVRAPGDLAANLRYYVGLASWYAWPAWLLALWGAWSLRAEWRSPRIFVPAAAILAGLPAIAWFGPPQDVNATPLLAPLALLGAVGAPRLRRGAAAALDWFGVMTFSVFALLVWLGYVAMLTGTPPRIAHNFYKTAPGYALAFDAVWLVLAIALALGWLALVLRSDPAPARAALRWAAGIVVLWGSFAFLWLPWADHQKSYRAVALQLKQRIPPGAGCIAGQGLGAPQRAALSYHASIRTVASEAKCGYLLVQGHPQRELGADPADWRKLADVGRPGDKGERFRLYQRVKKR